MNKIQLLLWAFATMKGSNCPEPESIGELLRMADMEKAKAFMELKVIDVLNEITVQDLISIAIATK